MLLKTLNTTVHHEMLAPLKANIQICERVLRLVKDQPHLKELVQTLFISSQMLMLHANDMLDQRIIENGSFVAHPTIGSPIDTIWDIINLISQTTKEKGLKIVCRTDALNNLPAKLRFDQRRYQQVLLNLLNNAVKYSNEGTICVRATIIENQQQQILQTIVSDQGIGLTPEEQKQIFTPFALLGKHRTMQQANTIGR